MSKLDLSKDKSIAFKTKVSLDLAKKLYEIRKKAGLTQKDLASRLEIKQPTYARMEGGQNMTIANIHKVAEACGFDAKVTFHPKGD